MSIYVPIQHSKICHILQRKVKVDAPFDKILRSLICKTIKTVTSVNLRANVIFQFFIRVIMATCGRPWVFQAVKPTGWHARFGFTIPRKDYWIRWSECMLWTTHTDNFCASVFNGVRELVCDLGYLVKERGHGGCEAKLGCSTSLIWAGA